MSFVLVFPLPAPNKVTTALLGRINPGHADVIPNIRKTSWPGRGEAVEAWYEGQCFASTRLNESIPSISCPFSFFSIPPIMTSLQTPLPRKPAASSNPNFSLKPITPAKPIRALRFRLLTKTRPLSARPATGLIAGTELPRKRWHVKDVPALMVFIGAFSSSQLLHWHDQETVIRKYWQNT